ncbi:caspase-7-like isoform X3 [Mytilus californianus]|uniref:caspase-7-like isoform X2 n=1 Tax=Mytilus californianus TaxID=6549 RepID=UPI0022459E42|nr:caspase-7-like isoform X2 [Mytilus californianus]XP_052098331.1 caspase-7-like isoform X3 [Mytilus californianus]
MNISIGKSNSISHISKKKKNMQSESQFDDSSIMKLVRRMKQAFIVKPESISGTNEDYIRSSIPSGEFNDNYGFSSRQRELNAHLNTTRFSSDTRNSNSYQFTGRKIGYAIFIINCKFDAQSERPFADLDCKNMKKLFEQLGFEIKMLENNSSEELLQNLKVIRNSIGRDHDCMTCIISSHGCEIPTRNNERQHVIFTKDSTVLTEDILHNFGDDECKNLVGKPKMFFIQACRCVGGVSKTSDIDKGFDIQDKSAKCNAVSSTENMNEESVFQIPCDEDFLVMFTCSSGRLGISDPSKGGWLMYCLFHVFEKLLDTNYEQDFLQILTRVCGKMARELVAKSESVKEYDKTKSAAVIYIC